MMRSFRALLLLILMVHASMALLAQIPQNIHPETDPKPIGDADQTELTLYIAAAVIIFIIAMVWFWWRRQQLKNDEED